MPRQGSASAQHRWMSLLGRPGRGRGRGKSARAASRMRNRPSSRESMGADFSDQEGLLKQVDKDWLDRKDDAL